MTTIAADSKAGVMCSDSFWFAGDECGQSRKIWRVRGELIGLAGDLDLCAVWLDAYRKGKPLKANVAAIRLGSKGIDCWDLVNGWIHAHQYQFAIGTGGKAARAAMAAGASCAAAVKIVVSIDATSGGPVRSYRLGAA